MSLKTIVTSKAKKLKSCTGKSRSISRQGLKFPIQRDTRFKCEDKFWIFFKSQKLDYYSADIQQSIDPSTYIQTPRIRSVTYILKPRFKKISLSELKVTHRWIQHILSDPKEIHGMGPTTCKY